MLKSHLTYKFILLLAENHKNRSTITFCCHSTSFSVILNLIKYGELIFHLSMNYNKGDANGYNINFKRR